MEPEGLKLRILVSAQIYLGQLTSGEQAAVIGDLEYMRDRNFSAVHTKQLKGPIRELIVGNHRFTYFQLVGTIYFVRGFRKKTTRTPKSEIGYAESVYKIFKSTV